VIVLDTNVLSALMQDAPDRHVSRWLDSVPPGSIRVTSISIFELRYGIEQLPASQRRRLLQASFDKAIDAGFSGRVLPLDQAAAAAAAAIAAGRKRAGRANDLRDTLIAGIAVSRGAEIATRNVRHFSDLNVSVIDPWQIELN
jgi:predicted nucleic acid-binding protein